MKYIYMLAWSILGTGLSIATDDAALNALGKQTDNQPLYLLSFQKEAD